MLELFLFGCALEKGNGVVDFLGVIICGIPHSVGVSEEDFQSVSCRCRILYRIHSMAIYTSVRSHNFLTARNHVYSLTSWYLCFGIQGARLRQSSSA